MNGCINASGMTATWLDLNRPLGPGLDRLLWDLDDHLQARSIPYLLTGGMAGEILLYYGHGGAPGRVQDPDDLPFPEASRLRGFG